MSKERLKAKCTICENLETEEVQAYPSYPMLPAPEFPFPSYYKCKSTNELIKTDDVETKRDCEHFMKIKDEEVLQERMMRARGRISTEDLDEMFQLQSFEQSFGKPSFSSSRIVQNQKIIEFGRNISPRYLLYLLISSKILRKIEHQVIIDRDIIE